MVALTALAIVPANTAPVMLGASSTGVPAGTSLKVHIGNINVTTFGTGSTVSTFAVW
ncbi:hypothetical protein [Cryobacterium sp. Y50]|uniref:hypothetical protein n=1 Tax=Cryobacterium sp. Y50 TaxID=2048286 RepID=UPI001304D5A1|nr:hypothetical protein [Cryobacterium sp. Y50]